MKKMKLAIALIAAAMLSGCATPIPIGVFYTAQKLPLEVTGNNSKSPRVGTAECTSVLALIAMGDCSVEAAKINGGITKVNHVDWDINNIMGFYGVYKTVVYGE